MKSFILNSKTKKCVNYSFQNDNQRADQQMMNSKLRHRIEEIVKLTDSEVDFVRSYFTAKKFKKHQFLIQESNYVTNDFWEVKGLVKSFHSDMGGKEHIMQFAMEDWRVTD